jgi:predicted O-methyltransferase YrrM
MTYSLVPTTLNEFTLDGVRFEWPQGDMTGARTTAERVIILKNILYIQYYADLLIRNGVTRVVELGVYQGGTAIALALLVKDLKIVSFDIAPPDEQVLARIATLGLSERVKLHYGVSQSDKETIHQVVAEEFRGQLVDLVIDDASHDYELSRRSIEILLPLLGPKAIYVLEDWGWAHWGGGYETREVRDRPALSNLVFEWTMLIASRSDVFVRMEVQGGWVALFRDSEARFDDVPLRSLYRNRGADIVPV